LTSYVDEPIITQSIFCKKGMKSNGRWNHRD
jgi:hypothetical protein